MDLTEQGRLEALYQYEILDTPVEPDFDRLCELAAMLCATPIAVITLVDQGRQWFKASVGLGIRETDRAVSFCTHTIAEGKPLIVPDARIDPMFSANPLVTGEPHIVFYAGFPLVCPAGDALGTLAVIDRVPRTLDAQQLQVLDTLAVQVMTQLELRRQAIILRRTMEERDRLQSAQLRDSRARFEHVARATTDTIWDWDLLTDTIWWNEGLATTFGYPPASIEKESSSWTRHIHPDDRERVLAGVRHAIDSGAQHWQDEYRFRRSDGSYAEVHDRGFVLREGAMAVRMIGGMSDVTERRGMDAALRASEERYHLATQASEAALWDWQLPGTEVVYSERFRDMLGLTAAQFPNRYTSVLRRMHPDDRRPAVAALRKYLRSRLHAPTRLSFRLRTEFEGYRWFESSAQAVWDADNRPTRMVGSTVDVHERKLAVIELARANRAWQMLSRCNEALTRATDELQLMHNICLLAVEVGGYDMAWVSYVQDSPGQGIAPVAWFPDDERAAFLQELAMDCGPDAPASSPCKQAILFGKTLVCEDFPATLDGPFRARARELGYRMLITLPLRDRNGTFGLLALLAAHSRPVPAEETALLQELVDDLAFGIVNLRAAGERNRLQQAVLKVAAGVSGSSGEVFFEELVRRMSEATGADAACLARLENGQARTLVALAQGRLIDNFSYPLAGTPCEHLTEHSEIIVNDGLPEAYPGSASMLSQPARAYVGRCLRDSKGAPVGLLFMLFLKPLKESGFVASTLQIFAARAGAELERQIADAHIRDQAALLDKAQDAIIVRDLASTIIYWNKGAERLYGWQAEDVMGRPVTMLSPDGDGFRDSITAHLLLHGEWSGELEQCRKDGSVFTIEAHRSLVRDSDGVPKSVLEINTDITQRKADEQQILTLAFFDSLTHLPNRALLMDRLEQALTRSARTQQPGALLFIDLDNFKSLNDTLGHDKGDMLLQQVAARLLACVRHSDTVARLGGDEFVVLMETVSSHTADPTEAPRAVADKILHAFVEPFSLNGHQYRSTPSIGIALFDHKVKAIDELLRWADLAMYQAKAAGRNTMRFFNPQMQAAVSGRVAMEAALRDAISGGEFVLHFQPQVNSSGAVIGAEALVRWNHPQQGMMPPAEFIGLAEETGLIVPLGEWVLARACAQLAMWSHDPARAHLSLAVNVSICQFRDAGFVGQVIDNVQRTGIDPQRLKLELTESLLIDDVEATIAKMDTLKRLGIGFSLDDFGTGYSSLAYLKRLPLDQLKIDQSFVRDIMSDPNDAAIAKTIVALGHSLGMHIIAEGVETEAQRRYLVEHGCTEFQGYLFSKPLPIAQFDRLAPQIGQAPSAYAH